MENANTLTDEQRAAFEKMTEEQRAAWDTMKQAVLDFIEAIRPLVEAVVETILAVWKQIVWASYVNQLLDWGIPLDKASRIYGKSPPHWIDRISGNWLARRNQTC